MSLEKETLARTFIFLLRDRQKHKGQSSCSKKIRIHYTEGPTRVRQEGELKNLLNSLMRILKASIIILQGKNEWSWEF
jgi:hypothetical protein